MLYEVDEKDDFGGTLKPEVDDFGGHLLPLEKSTQSPIIHSPEAKFSAMPQPTGVFGKASQWLGDLQGDIRHGTGDTLPGRALSFLGAKGTENGSPSAVSDYMASPILGPLRAMKGITEIPQGQISQGAKDIGGGVLQAAQFPLAMAGPEISEAAAVRKPMSVAEGVLSGAAKSAFPAINYSGHQIPIPASIAGAAAGHYAGSVFGPIGGKVGAVLGGGIPIVKGAIQGGRQALRGFNIQELMDSAVPRTPAWVDFAEHEPLPTLRPDEIGIPGELPSGQRPGPAPPSRTNPPLPRGNAPRIPMWQRTAITGEPQSGVPDMEPIYPRSPVLESGRTLGARPSLTGGPNPGTVVNGLPEFQPPRTDGVVDLAPTPVAATQPGIPPIGQTPSERVQAMSNSSEGTVGTRAEMMRQLRLADQSGASDPEKAAIIRRFEAPEYTLRPDRALVDPRESSVIEQPLPRVDTPSTIRSRANGSRAKFDENGKRNQLK